MNFAIRPRRNVGILAAVCAAAITSTGFAQDSDRPMPVDRPALTTSPTLLTAEQEKDLAAFYASKLFLANQGEIELCEMAAARSTTAAIKTYTESAHREHVVMLEALKTMVPSSLGSTVSASKITANETDDEIEISDEDDEFGEGESDDDVAGTIDDSTESSGRSTVGRVTYTEISDPILRRVSEIEMAATKNRVTACQAKMNRVRGAEFDAAFIHHEIAWHENLIAELNALNGLGSSEFRSLVSRSSRTMNSQLEAAREVANSLQAGIQDDDEREDDIDDEGDDGDEGDDDGLLDR